MNAHARASSIIKDILVNHLPRVVDGLEKGYVDENQILVIYDHAVRARILTEQAEAEAPKKCEPFTPQADADELIQPPAESDPRSATWPQWVMTRGEARKLGLIS